VADGAGVGGDLSGAAAVTAKVKQGLLRELFGTIVPAIAIAVAIQAVLIKPFRIPSESMLPTLLVGDYLFVSKFAYGYSRYSFPFSPPLFSGRIFGSLPRRGDVAVFRLPLNDTEDYIKRVVGLPGDTVQMIGGVLHLNGSPVPREPLPDYTAEVEGRMVKAAQWRETLPNGVSYATLDLDPAGPLDDAGPFRVPPGHLFMMGDNRDDSADSRMQSVVGYVPVENLVGRAEIIFFSVRGGASAWEFWRWPETVRTERLLTRVR
jgi:signal peptidase I